MQCSLPRTVRSYFVRFTRRYNVLLLSEFYGGKNKDEHKEHDIMRCQLRYQE
jgi:hypothetical protein